MKARAERKELERRGWQFVEAYTARDGFTAGIYEQPGMDGQSTFAAFTESSGQLFGMQRFPTIERARAALEG